MTKDLMVFDSPAGISIIESENAILSCGQIRQIDSHIYGQISHILIIFIL